MSLVELLDEMFAASQQTGAGVHRQLSSGLHVKVGLRGQRRMIIVWRSADKLPSAKECEILGEDAGLYDPKYRLWRCQESEDAFLITEGYRGELCDHRMEFFMHVNARPKFQKAWRCSKCGIVAGVAYSTRKSAKEKHFYGKWELREHVWQAWCKRGPATDALSDQPHHKHEGISAPPVAAAKPKAKASPKTDAQRQAERDKAERRHLTGLLTCVSFAAACRNRWFRNDFVMQARRAYLEAAKLPELREEVSGRWFAHSYRHALPYALLACRWRHQYRALPLKATAAKRSRKPRRKKAEVAAA